MTVCRSAAIGCHGVFAETSHISPPMTSGCLAKRLSQRLTFQAPKPGTSVCSCYLVRMPLLLRQLQAYGIALLSKRNIAFELVRITVSSALQLSTAHQA